MTACSDFHMRLVNGYCFIASFSSAIRFVGSATWGSVSSDVVPVGLSSKWLLRPAASTAKRKQSQKKIQLVPSALHAGSLAKYSPSLVVDMRKFVDMFLGQE